MKKRFLALSLALAMCLAMLTGCGGGNDAATDDVGSTDDAAPGTPEVTWVASCANADDHPAVQGVHKFAELVEEKSGGRMHIDVFANAQLASDRDCIEGMQMNTIQSGIMVSSALAGFTDELLVFDLPFLFENSAQGQAVCDSDVGQQILGTLEDIGIKGLGWMEYGMRNITNSVRPISTPADLAGLKIRVMSSPVFIRMYEVLGANPTPMSFSEVFTGLQQNVINGQENPPTLIYASGFQEVQKYLTLDNHVHNFLAVLTNENWLNSLSADDQQLVKDCVAEMVTTQRSMELEDNDAVVAKLQDAGMEVNELTDEQYQAFVDAVQPMYDEYKQQWGTEIFDLATSYNK